MGNKILVLLGVMDWFAKSMHDTRLVDVDTVYHPVSKLERRLRTLHYHTGLPKARWYSEWKNHLDEYDTVILFDAFLGTDVAEYIEMEAAHVRLIVFYFNPWYNNYYLSDIARKKAEIWSFDKNDCIHHDLCYNHQFYFYGLTNQVIDTHYYSDLYFVGRDKGRLPLLMKLQETLSEKKIHFLAQVVGDQRGHYTEAERDFLHMEYMPYEAVLMYVKNTKCLLEIVQEHQEGLTMRMMEAMFFNKKIITNNKNVLSYDFYDSRNIYVLGEDKRPIETFILEESTAAWDPALVQSYSFEDWLNNFFKNT